MKLQEIQVRITVDLTGPVSSDGRVPAIYSVIRPRETAAIGVIVRDIGLAIRRAEIEHGKQSEDV